MPFTSRLIRWYHRNKRDLPFRGTRDPYLVWISEVILQQTRMEQGLGYYTRFVERFPDIRALASGTEEEVLKLWQGLGYYDRARHLHASAVHLVNDSGGLFPGTFNGIRGIKGIGDYSAASIASLCFDEPVPAIDGNVFRFVARYTGIADPAGSAKGKQKAMEWCLAQMDRNDPGTFNQAMIEFGALVCKPARPDCDGCQFRTSCYAFSRKLTGSLPVKQRPAKVRHRYFHYLVIVKEQKGIPHVVIRKRTGNDIWKNLYDFPLIETGKKISARSLSRSEAFRSLFPDREAMILRVYGTSRHVLSHQVIHATFYRTDGNVSAASPGISVSAGSLSRYPMPRLISRFIQESLFM
jgi:A/G-specific adenine glycosylase